MASIALTVIGCIDYLAYGSIFTRAMVRPKKKFDVFFSAKKSVIDRREVVTLPQNHPQPREETKNKLVLSKIDFCFRLEIYFYRRKD
jgi:hypothetical protein